METGPDQGFQKGCFLEVFKYSRLFEKGSSRYCFVFLDVSFLNFGGFVGCI